MDEAPEIPLTAAEFATQFAALLNRARKAGFNYALLTQRILKLYKKAHEFGNAEGFLIGLIESFDEKKEGV